MSTTLQEPLSVLCDEVGVPMPQPDSRGSYSLEIDGQTLRVSELKNQRVILAGVVGNLGVIAAKRETSRQDVLANCLGVQAVRFAKLATAEVLTFEPETDELILWTGFDGPSISIPAFLQGAESMLNELEFWKNWLAAS